MKKNIIEIIPAILEKKISAIEKLIKKSVDYVNTIQIDVCDGKLTPAKTFASSGCEISFQRLVKFSKKVDLELDMIVDMDNITGKNPKGRGDKFLNSIKKSQAKRVVFHFSGVKNWKNIFQLKQGSKASLLEIGLGIWLTDDVKKVSKILNKFSFDYIQIMGIEKVGFGGQKLSAKVYGKIRYFHKKFPKLPIQIDGGVKIHNSQKLKKAGAIRLVSGSGFFEAADLKKRAQEFKKI